MKVKFYDLGLERCFEYDVDVYEETLVLLGRLADLRGCGPYSIELEALKKWRDYDWLMENGFMSLPWWHLEDALALFTAAGAMYRNERRRKEADNYMKLNQQNLFPNQNLEEINGEWYATCEERCRLFAEEISRRLATKDYPPAHRGWFEEQGE